MVPILGILPGKREMYVPQNLSRNSYTAIRLGNERKGNSGRMPRHGSALRTRCPVKETARRGYTAHDSVGPKCPELANLWRQSRLVVSLGWVGGHQRRWLRGGASFQGDENNCQLVLVTLAQR